MNTSTIVWIGIASLFAMLIIVRFVFSAIHRMHLSKPRHIISLGSEREEFFLPGDPIREEDDSDDED